jgi:hypothetical protein
MGMQFIVDWLAERDCIRHDPVSNSVHRLNSVAAVVQ